MRILGCLFLLLFLPCAQAKVSTLLFDSQRVDIEWPSDMSQKEQADTQQWLNEVHQALTLVYGELPKDQLLVKLSRSTGSRSPVPWGQIKRTDPNQVILTINPALGYDKLINDWTLFHELSHLLIPYRGWGDLWLSEGLASYYQNILQGRAGYFTEQKMWQKLVAGFGRGAKVKGSVLSLKRAGDNRARGQIMRTYWSGALFWLTVDVDLRRYHESSLDQFLAHLKACCETKHMSANEIIAQLVTFSQSTAFNTLFLQYRYSTRMPDAQPILDELGVVGANNALRLTKNASLSKLRQNLYQGM